MSVVRIAQIRLAPPDGIKVIVEIDGERHETYASANDIHSAIMSAVHDLDARQHMYRVEGLNQQLPAIEQLWASVLAADTAGKQDGYVAVPWATLREYLVRAA